MRLPYDVALERGWSTGVATFSIEDNLVEFSPHRRDTTIGKRMHYRAVKKHFMLRMTAHWFRTHDQLRRWLYATWARRLQSR
jgi:glycosyl transferase, family 25